ncbi:MAG: DUF444 family protein [Candidatus Poribacteria bacterium]|nr:DUF444 family protein [Candidatus Poribacteria bacterium]
MVRRIEKDRSRFRQIVRKNIRKDLRKYITHTGMIGRKGKDLVSIPMPHIDLPRFKFGLKNTGGVGQGEGEPGTPIGPGQPEAGSGKAGDLPGQHVLEVDVNLEELAEILGEELELPNIQPKGKKNIVAQSDRYTGISVTGPKSLRHFKRTYREALKRQVIMGDYNRKDPVIIPIKEDERFRTWKTVLKPESNAVIFYMMDVSGSMGEEQKEIVRIEAFWIDLWLRSQYKGIEARYIIHDAEAREVDQHTFYHTRESGGTRISSAYELFHRIVQAEYDTSEWNIYGFHFSDGDNWGDMDNGACLRVLRGGLLRCCNLFCYGQVASAWGSGDFLRVLEDNLRGVENFVMSQIDSRDDILDSIKTFLGKGK